MMVLLLSACTSTVSTELEGSTTFSIPVLFENDKKGQYILIGEEGKFGFLIGSGLEDEEIKIMPLIANEPNKYMWHFWGQNLTGQSLKVIGTNVETNEETVILDNFVLAGALNGADAHTPSSMVFPNAGIWQLDVYVGEDLLGNIIVEVN